MLSEKTLRLCSTGTNHPTSEQPCTDAVFANKMQLLS